MDPLTDVNVNTQILPYCDVSCEIFTPRMCLPFEDIRSVLSTEDLQINSKSKSMEERV